MCNKGEPVQGLIVVGARAEVRSDQSVYCEIISMFARPFCSKPKCQTPTLQNGGYSSATLSELCESWKLKHIVSRGWHRVLSVEAIVSGSGGHLID
jgi:hypothetical protein